MSHSPITTSKGGSVTRKIRAIVMASASLLGLMGAEEPDPRALVQVKQHLARIGEGMIGHRGEGAGKSPPWAIRDKDGKPLLS
jgi:hypothetical protein